MANNLWTSQDIRRLKKMVRDGATYRDISIAIRRTEMACQKKASLLGIHAGGTEGSEAYGRGQAARNVGMQKHPPYQQGVNYWRWMAGWHDADMAKGVSYIDQLRSKHA